MEAYYGDAFNSRYYVYMGSLLQIVAEESIARLRKINSDYLIELVEILEAYGPELTESMEPLSKQQRLHFEIDKLNARFAPRYANAIEQFKMDMRIYYGDVCKYPLGVCASEEKAGWERCQMRQKEDLLTVQLLAVQLAHVAFADIFAYLSGKGPEEHQELVSRCNYAAISPTNTSELRLVIANLEKKIDRFFNRKDLTIYFTYFLDQKKVELGTIFDKYNDTGSFEQERCNLCAIQEEFWIVISNPEQELIISRRMPTILGFCFQKYFFLELENLIVYLQNKLDE